MKILPVSILRVSDVVRRAMMLHFFNATERKERRSIVLVGPREKETMTVGDLPHGPKKSTLKNAPAKSPFFAPHLPFFAKKPQKDYLDTAKSPRPVPAKSR